MNLREFSTWAREAGTLIEIDRPVDPRLELARVIHALDGRPVRFRALAEFPGWEALTGTCAQRSHFAAALGCEAGDLVHRLADALANPVPPPSHDAAPCQEITHVKMDTGTTTM